jgi:hypothetical protein
MGQSAALPSCLIFLTESRRPMTLADKIPTMSDEEVVNLLANARRLSDSADEKQRAAAQELLPVLEGAAAERKANRLAAAQAKRAAKRQIKAKAA